MSEHEQTLDMLANILSALQETHSAIVRLSEAVAGRVTSTPAETAAKAVEKAKKSAKEEKPAEPEIDYVALREKCRTLATDLSKKIERAKIKETISDNVASGSIATAEEAELPAVLKALEALA